MTPPLSLRSLDRPVARWTVFALVGLVLLTGSVSVAGRFAAERSTAELQRQSAAAAALHEAVMRSQLEKHRSLPFVLAEDPDVKALLRSGDPAQVSALNQKLESLSGQTRAAVIYVLDARGRTLAASNWRLPTSFVGSDYSFRPYFRNAMRGGTAEQFALGTVSQRPGLFLSRRVRQGDTDLGVVVVKLEFDALEAEWRASGEPAFVTDPHGVVLVTSVPAWRFRTLQPLPQADRTRLRQGLQFGRAPLEPLPFVRKGDELSIRAAPGTPEKRFVAAGVATSTPGWTLHLLTPADRALDNAVAAARSVALLATASLLLTAGALLYWRERAHARALRREADRVELEARVEARTRELRDANDRLVLEMEERRRAEAGLQTLQDELVQANKLATLGQIAAGVAHEINQPVAAIRAYADNAAVFLDRAQPGPARKNLTVIADLTQRIGLITDELRAFSRKTSRHAHPVAVEDALSGALLLVGARLRQQGVRLERTGPPAAGVQVVAERVRLEQVLVNLLQNALEALEGVADPRVRLSVEADDAQVRITVADNGPGLAPDAAAALFTPFNTTKAQGLGLGLVISRDIVTEFGGDLSAAPSADGGAAFLIVLKRAV
ncbi:ATP-binding protein [Caulobacter sp. 17J65-9]|uniref:sensor histidine kinase n=1 Tax=Caulobacter sp. 17J65-9 TaxID=2709382 RepID=UPI0013C66FFA|nr:ATP-binding protein [Caulobacter sp. 17J65-9]NEX91533.1 sensor histidine kinase [Caulobacter sp. 17J65-9]